MIQRYNTRRQKGLTPSVQSGEGQTYTWAGTRTPETFAICGHRADDNDDHSRAVPAGSAYTDEEVEREKMKDKAFFEQAEEPMQIGIGVHAGAKK